MFVHGSVRNPINEYVFPEDVHNRRKMEKLFSMVLKVCFQGTRKCAWRVHGRYEILAHQMKLAFDFVWVKKSLMINVGSVGQPRDGDWRRCYVISKNLG